MGEKCACVCARVRMCMCAHTCSHGCTHVCLHGCMCVHAWVCACTVHTCMCACRGVCMHCGHVHVCTCMHGRAHVCACVGRRERDTGERRGRSTEEDRDRDRELTTPDAIQVAAEVCVLLCGGAFVPCARGASIRSRLCSGASAGLPTHAPWRAGLITSNNSNSSSSPDLKADIFPTVWNCISQRSANRHQARPGLPHCSHQNF